MAVSATFAQSTEETEAELKAQLDKNGNLTFKCIIDSLNMSKDELYQRVYDYFVYTYGDAQEVFQKTDKEAGIIIGKGIYASITPTIWRCDAWHITRVDIKDNRIRILISILKYKIGGGQGDREFLISNVYPFSDRTYGMTRNMWLKIHNHAHMKANANIAGIRKAVTEGMTNNEDANEDW